MQLTMRMRSAKWDLRGAGSNADGLAQRQAEAGDLILQAYNGAGIEKGMPPDYATVVK